MLIPKAVKVWIHLTNSPDDRERHASRTLVASRFVPASATQLGTGLGSLMKAPSVTEIHVQPEDINELH